MRKWREENSRNSEQIVEVGEELISEYASKLGDDSKFLNLLCSCSAHVSFTVYFFKSCHYDFSALNINPLLIIV